MIGSCCAKDLRKRSKGYSLLVAKKVDGSICVSDLLQAYESGIGSVENSRRIRCQNGNVEVQTVHSLKIPLR